ncbi:MAG: hypothetical protein LBM59_03620 [Ruminococcus sp.]|jgi:hypothetical protein|nr:hypothetical protein [Ruminococcus sp.]
MKKEELIRRAAEHGISIDETQAEKYINLSDEELENLEISGGACGDPPPPHQLFPVERAANCAYYEKTGNPLKNSCQFCKYSGGTVNTDVGKVVKCTNQAAWQPA